MEKNKIEIDLSKCQKGDILVNRIGLKFEVVEIIEDKKGIYPFKEEGRDYLCTLIPSHKPDIKVIVYFTKNGRKSCEEEKPSDFIDILNKERALH